MIFWASAALLIISGASPTFAANPHFGISESVDANAGYSPQSLSRRALLVEQVESRTQRERGSRRERGARVGVLSSSGPDLLPEEPGPVKKPTTAEKPAQVKKPAPVDEPEEESTATTTPRTAGLETGAARTEAESTGGGNNALATSFDGMGSPYGGCGVGMKDAVDDSGKQLPYVALNVYNPSVGISDPDPPRNKDTFGEFANGANCGRWMEITFGNNCVGGARYAPTEGITGKKIYGYVMDSCADNNNWCRKDAKHVDISKPYLADEGLLNAADPFNGPEISWKYISGPPAGYKQNLKFSFKSGSSQHWAVVAIINPTNGIGSVKTKLNNQWVDCERFLHLGNMWKLPGTEGNTVELEVFSVSGASYGRYAVDYPCASGSCGSDTTPQFGQKL